jgi:hypothetical protein
MFVGSRFFPPFRVTVKGPARKDPARCFYTADSAKSALASSG